MQHAASALCICMVHMDLCHVNMGPAANSVILVSLKKLACLLDLASTWPAHRHAIHKKPSSQLVHGLYCGIAEQHMQLGTSPLHAPLRARCCCPRHASTAARLPQQPSPAHAWSAPRRRLCVRRGCLSFVGMLLHGSRRLGQQGLASHPRNHRWPAGQQAANCGRCRHRLMLCSAFMTRSSKARPIRPRHGWPAVCGSGCWLRVRRSVFWGRRQAHRTCMPCARGGRREPVQRAGRAALGNGC